MTAMRHRVPMLAAGATFLAMLDSTVANLAIPDLHGDFPDTTVAGLTWVITLYTVLFAALLAPAGRLADLIGRRTLFQAGVGLFTLTSLACAIAPTLPVLLATRALQGAAAAAMIPASLAVLLHDAAPERRAAAIGLWSASGAFAAAIGPGLGGILVDAFGWRAVFLINVPIGLVMLVAGARLPRTTAARSALPDMLGTALLGGGIGMIVLGVTQTQAWDLVDPRTLGALVAGGAMVAMTLWRSVRHPVPAIETSLWRSRTFAVANLTSALYGAALYSWLLLGVLFLTSQWHYSILKAGFASTPGALTATVAAIGVGKLTGRWGVRPAVVGGSLMMVVSGALMIAFLPGEPNFLAFWLPVGLLLGTGMGAAATGAAGAAALSVSPERFAGATGLNTTARQLGGALGIAALAALLPSPAGVDDYATVYWFSTIAALGAAVSGIWLTLRSPAEQADGASAGRRREGAPA